MKSVKCPICNHEMIVKSNQSGVKFWGCSKYPECKGSRNFHPIVPAKTNITPDARAASYLNEIDFQLDHKKKYIFYGDESGTDHYLSWITICCIGMLFNEAPKFNSRINELKKEYWSHLDPSDFEIKSNLIRRLEYPFDESNISLDRLNEFLKKFYNLFDEFDLTILAASMNKKGCYHVNNIYGYTYNLLRVRIDKYKKGEDMGRISLLMDDRQSKLNKELISLDTELKNIGDRYAGRLSDEISLNMRDSKQYPGIQLADLCAYNISRALQDNDPNYSYFKLIKNYFHVGSKGQIIGYGLYLGPKHIRLKLQKKSWDF